MCSATGNTLLHKIYLNIKKNTVATGRKWSHRTVRAMLVAFKSHAHAFALCSNGYSMPYGCWTYSNAGLIGPQHGVCTIECGPEWVPRSFNLGMGIGQTALYNDDPPWARWTQIGATVSRNLALRAIASISADQTSTTGARSLPDASLNERSSYFASEAQVRRSIIDRVGFMSF